MQSIARDSDDSSDDEFFDAHGTWSLNHHHLFLKWWGKRKKGKRVGGERGRKRDFHAF